MLVRDSRRVETTTQKLHRLTSYAPGREWDEAIADPEVLQDLEVNDLARLPWFFKCYEADLPRIPLPRDLPTTTASAVEVLAGRADAPEGDLDLSQLARLLYLSAGVTRKAERPYGFFLFRAAGSAGGRFPLELYVAVPEGGTLPPGVHWYDPLDHELLEVGPAPDGEVPALVVTGVPWRTGWRYRERGFRHIYWDAGTMLAQSLALTASAGISARLHTRFPDAQITELVGADGVHEWPVAVVRLGDGAPALRGTGAALSGEVDAAPVEFPLVTSAQCAGVGEELGAPWDAGAPVDVTGEGGTVESVILARGSQRLMDPTRGLSEDLLRTSMDAALRGIDIPHWVAIHDVDDVAPGIYRWPDLVTPVRAGNMRDELYRVSLEQGLARDAAFVVIAAADVSALDDAEYREAQLAAGLVEGRLHLMAYALGAGASGMTFMDSEIPELLGAPVDALLFTCVGVPGYRSSPGGNPGAPRAVVTPAPRL
jgi:hypothetical protein